MHEIEDARRLLCERADKVLGVETLAAANAAQRYCANDIQALVDNPPADNSAMDGYAIALEKYKVQRIFPISQTIPAGKYPSPLAPNSAARILTGATVPDGANCVVLQENCSVQNGVVTVTPELVLTPGDNIRKRGEDFNRQQKIISRGERINAARSAILAAAGIQELAVFKPPKVVVISSGNELAEPGRELKKGQIFNSNQTMLVHLLNSWGAKVIKTETLADDLAHTIEALQAASQIADLIVTSGGVSVGDEDHLRSAVNTLGHIELWKVNMKPGKPLAFGHIGENKTTPIFCLPGNPVSSFVTSWLFLKPFIERLFQAPYRVLNPHFGEADFTRQVKSRTEFARARYENGKLTLHQNQSSGVITSLVWANVLVQLDANRSVSQGDRVPYYQINTV